MSQEIQNLPLHQIQADPHQPRRQHSEESLQGLADSIRQHGLLHPIRVSPSPEGGYLILTGERRWRAAAMARLETIPSLVQEVPADERLTIQLIENLQREDLQPLEKAQAIQQVRTALHLTNREIARRLGLSERSVGYLLDLLDLPEEIGEAVVSSPNRPSEGKITEKHARFLKQLNSEPELQTAVVERVKNERLTSENTGKLVRALKKQPQDTEEILHAPADHLDRFFESHAAPPAPARPLPVSPAKRALDLLPVFAELNPDKLPAAEISELEEALQAVHIAVESLLQQCRNRKEQN